MSGRSPIWRRVDARFGIGRTGDREARIEQEGTTDEETRTFDDAPASGGRVEDSAWLK